MIWIGLVDVVMIALVAAAIGFIFGVIAGKRIFKN